MKFKWLAIMTVAIFICSFSNVYAVTADDAYQAGYAYYKQAQWDQCLGQMNAAIALNPYYWQAYEVIGYVYTQEGNSQAALSAYQQSLQINPNNPQLQQIVNNLQAQSSPAPPTINTDTQIHSFYFNLSSVAPYSPIGFSNSWGAGGSLGVAYGLGINKVTSIVFSVQYSNFPSALTYPGVTLSGGGIHTLMFLVNGKFDFCQDNPVNFYIITGLGPAEFTSDALTATNISTGQTATTTATALTETDFALRLGLGIDIRLSKGVALSIESDGVDTFVSPRVSSTGYMSSSMFLLGMNFEVP